jgi:hypothetical protein
VSAKDVVIRGAGVLVVAGVLIGGGSYVIGDGGATANLWVDTTGGTCTRSASPAAYSDAAACATFDAAYDAASGGDSVMVKAGSYDPQGITGTKASLVTILPATGETVTVGGWAHLGTTATYVEGTSYTLDLVGGDTTGNFPSTTSCPDTGAGTCYVINLGISFFECTGKTSTSLTGCRAGSAGGLNPYKYYDGADIQPSPTIVSATNVELRDMRVNDSVLTGTGVTLRRVVGHRWYIDGGASNVSLIGGTYGDTTSGLVNSAGRSSTPTTVLIDGVTFQNMDARDAGGTPPSGDAHGECLHYGATNGLTIKNNIFKGCAVYNLSFFNLGGAGIANNVTVENNFFDCPTNMASPGNGAAPVRCLGGSGAAVSLNNTTTTAVTYTFRNNSLADGGFLVLELGGSGSFTGTTLIGNLGERGYDACNFSGVTCSYNVWERTFDCPGSNETNATCATNISPNYVSDTTADLHLVNGAAAEAKGSPSSCPTTDIDAEARPQPGATTCDAGADER